MSALHTAINTGSYKKHAQYILLKRHIREYLDQRGYAEVETPLLSPGLIPESYLEVFETEYRYFDLRQKLYLIPSHELYLKQLIAHGMGSCYRLGSSFRNGERSASLHSGEFTMLEYYRVPGAYMEMADELLGLFAYIANQMYGEVSIPYQGSTISFDSFERMTLTDAFEQFAGIDRDALLDENLFITSARKKGYVTDGHSYDELFSQIYGHEIEPHLGRAGRPTLLYDYPAQFAQTAKLNPDGSAARFDIYIEGIEIGNCYSELVDIAEVKTRFAAEQEKRRELGKISYPADESFISALSQGLPDCSGVALGIDRVGMLFTDAKSLQEFQIAYLTTEE